VTAHFSSGGATDRRGIITRVYTGNDATPYDGSANSGSTHSHSAGTDSVTSVSTVTPSVSGDLILGVVWADAAGDSAGTGFGNFIADDSGGYNSCMNIEDLTEAGTTAHAATFTATGGGQDLVFVTAFKVATASGTWPGGTLKEYNGSTWVRSKIKDYESATWYSCRGLKRWDGAQWLLINTTGR
jgi:hypothetical protein